jgi:hypothetical protein
MIHVSIFSINTTHETIEFKSMHGWADQFVTEPKSLFIKKKGQNLEIITNLH